MYQIGDTIAAVSSPTMDGRVIVRLSGSRAFAAVAQLSKSKKQISKSGIANVQLQIESQLKMDAKVYCFCSPHSYTGEDVVEIHFYTNQLVSEKLMERLFKAGIRQAGPGEFTARSFLNGRMDLSQAEAVNQIITGSNSLQIDSAQKLLSGRLSQITQNVKNELLDCLSLLEAGMDFSTEDIEFVSPQQAAQRLRKTKKQLDDLLNGAISYEITTALPSVGIAGAPNAGKSSLFNALLGKKRSIVSRIRKTTRDILTGTLIMGHNRCILFDCAGLTEKPHNIIDCLSQRAAIESLENCDLVVLCVDASKNLRKLDEDLQIKKLINPKALLAVATKADRLSIGQFEKSLQNLNRIFQIPFIAVSARTSRGIERLKNQVDKKILDSLFGIKADGPGLLALREMAAITGRHKHQLIEARDAITGAIAALKDKSVEGAAMYIRSCLGHLGGIDRSVDEQVLDKIFNAFCIGK